MQKILVTGSAGFIGHFTSIALARLGNSVLGVDNLNPYYPTSLKKARLLEAGFPILPENGIQNSTTVPNLSFTRLDISDREAVANLFARNAFDLVINLAAQPGVRYSIDHPHNYIESNIIGFMNILEGCRHSAVKHLIYASSSSVYGNPPSNKAFSVDQRVDWPVSLYAATKRSNELMAHVYSHLFGLRTTGLRFFTVYGPWGRPDMAYFIFAKAIIKNQPINVFNNGDLERDFTYIDDIVDGIVRIATSPEKVDNSMHRTHEDARAENFYVYNIGNNKPVKLIKFISILENLLGKTAIKKFMPMQPGDVRTTWADIEPIKKDFGYCPKTDIEDGLRSFVNWLKTFDLNQLENE
jgi:UDP-glucuronate 4-epimerase